MSKKFPALFAVVALSYILPAFALGQQGHDKPLLIHAICIEHIGDSDKRIIGIAISDSDAGIRLCTRDSEERVGLPDVWEHVIDSKLMTRLMEIANATSDDRGAHPHTFGTMALTIICAKDKRQLVLNRNHSAMCLTKLWDSCSDPSLRSRLANLRTQIAP